MQLRFFKVKTLLNNAFKLSMKLYFVNLLVGCWFFFCSHCICNNFFKIAWDSVKNVNWILELWKYTPRLNIVKPLNTNSLSILGLGSKRNVCYRLTCITLSIPLQWVKLYNFVSCLSVVLFCHYTFIFRKEHYHVTVV